jgi:hypothetical protein
MDTEEGKKFFLSMIRRVKYSMALLGIIGHSCITTALFKSQIEDAEIAAAYIKSDFLGLAAAFLFCAALIETGIYLMSKRLGD